MFELFNSVLNASIVEPAPIDIAEAVPETNLQKCNSKSAVSLVVIGISFCADESRLKFVNVPNESPDSSY